MAVSRWEDINGMAAAAAAAAVDTLVRMQLHIQKQAHRKNNLWKENYSYFHRKLENVVRMFPFTNVIVSE